MDEHGAEDKSCKQHVSRDSKLGTHEESFCPSVLKKYGSRVFFPLLARVLLKPLEKWCLSETRDDRLSESFVRSKIHQDAFELGRF